MKKQIRNILLLMVMLVGIASAAMAQTTTTESFDGTFPPTGWANTQVAGTGLWTAVATGTTPTCTTHSGAGMAKFDCWNYSTGTTANLVSAVQDYTLRGSNTPTVSFWMYRDNFYIADDYVNVYVNTTPSHTGATLLGTIYREYDLAPAATANTWNQYTFNIPAGFAGSTNYIIFQAYSDYGCNMFIDDVTLVSYPVLPGSITGWVRNSALNPIIGATITAGANVTTTGAGGDYTMLNVPPGPYTMTCAAPGYNSATVTGVVVPSGGTVTQNFTLTNPTMTVTPNPFNVTVNPNEYYTENMYILNQGSGNLHWTANVNFPPDDDNMGPVNNDPIVVGSTTPMTTVIPTADMSAVTSTVTGGTDAIWDVDFTMNCSSAYQYGVETDGTYIYTTNWGTAGTFYKYQKIGSTWTLVETFSIPGAGAIRDLAFDGTYFYGGAAAYVIYKMDFNSKTLVGTINVPTSTGGVRHISYDPTADGGNGGLWIGGWSNLNLVSMTGTILLAPTSPVASIAGTAYDNQSTGGPYLWIYSQTGGSLRTISQYKIATLALTGVTHEANVSGATGSAGGLASSASLVPGKFVLLGDVQQDPNFIFCYEIKQLPNWFTLDQYSGDVPATTNFHLPAHFNAANLTAGTVKTCDVTFTSTPSVGNWTIPVSMTVQGYALETPQNLVATLVDQLTGEVSLTWDAVPPTGLLNYIVNRDGVQIGTTTGTTYTDMLPTYGTYCYTVQAVYGDGAGIPTPCADVEWPNPTLSLDPTSLTATVWTGTEKPVPFTINNTGEGTLAFQFPDYIDDDAPLAYCTATASYCDEYISRVQFANIDNSSSCGYYQDFTGITAQVDAGKVYAITLTNPSPWSSDLAAVWIDFNHNEVFDANEQTSLVTQGGGASFTGNISIPTSSLPGVTRMRIRLSYASAPVACGTQSFGEVEDYSVNVIQKFVTEVYPTSGTVAGGGSVDAEATFSATGAFVSPGTYTQGLLITTNDLANASVSIPCTMIVTVPGMITGTVTDGVSGDLLQGVMVTAGAFTAMTDDNGVYSITCDANTYDVMFSKIGYQSLTVNGVVVTAGNTITVDAQLYEMPYAPGCASAVVNATDTQCDVTWCVPMGPYEMLYDDGTAENFAAWQLAGNLNAVKFTPAGYPATVVGGLFYVGDGSFPAGGNIIGATFTARVFDDDGAGGLPGTDLSGDGVVATVTAPGWVTVTGLNVTIPSGSFYLAMEQGTNEPNCAPIGVDESQPKAYKSYSKFVTAGGDWVLSAYQDFMIHAIVSGPVSDDDVAVSADRMIVSRESLAGVVSQHQPLTLPGYEMAASITSPEAYASDAVHHYKLYRFPVTDPNGPVYGTGVLLTGDITSNSYVDGGSTWAGLAQGWYAYGIKAVYPNGQESDYTYTNIVGHKMMADVTINVQLVCGFVPAVGAEVQMIGLDYPYETYTATVPASGTVNFTVWKGNYTVDVRTAGYLPFVVDYNITGPRTIDVILEDQKFAPRNLYVDENTLVATWEPPLLELVNENFEGAFPPAGWQMVSNGVGWYTGTSYSGWWTIPAHTGVFAVCNDDYTNDDECCSYLITPALNLASAPGFVLNFDGMFTGVYGGTATVELTTDGGATWTTIYTVPAGASWATRTVDLSAYSGPGGLTNAMIGFHYNDNGSWADGWAIDNVNISTGMTPTFGYGVFLDGSLVGNTNELTWTFNPTTITWGQTYVAGVAGLYCSGYSDQSLYTFRSNFLFPPRNLQGTNDDHTAILTWEPPVSGDAMVGAGITPDYSWMQSNGGNLSTTGNSGNAAPSNGFTAITNRAETEIYYCGEKNDAIGTGGAVEFMCAARFTSDELYAYYGLKQITKVSLFASNSGTWSNVTVKIWKGGSMGDPGTEVYSEDVTSQIVTEAWSTVTLGTPVPLEDGNEYWIGYYMNATGGWPAGCDAGPAVSGKGDWMYYSGAWQEIGPAFGLNYNWCIKGIIDDAGPQPANNLVGYVLYRDGDQIAEVPKTDLEYWDMNLDPATYCYDVTAKYDLTVYGFPGQFAESGKEGPACVDVFYGYGLPFIEDWTAGTFDLNQWTAGENWIVDGQLGNPYPSAKFKWDPILNDYSSSLESWWIDGSSVETTTPYKIWFDFDLALNDRTSSTNEKVNAEVWNGTAWKVVGEYANNGSFDWTTQHIDITNKAKDKVFKIRFNANGAASNDIYYWLVDNVKVYVEYLFNPPQTLVATPAAATGTIINDNHLTWTAPEGGGGGGSTHPPVWIHWDSGENSDAIGTGGAADFDVAARFDVSQLEEFDGMAVTKVAFWPNEAACEYSIRVWQGDMAANLLVDQVVSSPTIGAWNEVELDTPLAIDVTQELWFGVRCNAAAGYPAGCDAGPQVPDYGQWIYFQGAWSNLVDLNSSLTFNWNLQAYLEAMDDDSPVQHNPIVLGSESRNATGTLAMANYETPANATFVPAESNQTDAPMDLTGYNVYRRQYVDPTPGTGYTTLSDWAKINTDVVVPTEYWDNNLPNNCYDYYVTAVYTEGESQPSNIDAWNCIVVGVNNVEATDVRVYPNPATTYVNIDLTKDIKNIAVYNALGSVVMQKNITGESTIILHTTNYAAGAYNVKFVKANGDTFSRKFVVVK